MAKPLRDGLPSQDHSLTRQCIHHDNTDELKPSQTRDVHTDFLKGGKHLLEKINGKGKEWLNLRFASNFITRIRVLITQYTKTCIMNVLHILQNVTAILIKCPMRNTITKAISQKKHCLKKSKVLFSSMYPPAVFLLPNGQAKLHMG